jgi:hypothetical protein
MVDPKMTKFKAMSLDEQAMTIEKLAQESQRAREEMIVVEEAEVPLTDLVQDRGFPMTQDVQTKGMLMIKQAQRIIDQMQDDPDLTGMTESLADNPNVIQTGPSGPELIDIDEIVELDNPEIVTPQARSSRGVGTHPEIVRTSGRASAPNPISELINIYDDEESLEVFLVTLVQIIKEKEPKNTSSPAPDAQIHIPRNEQDVESVLDFDQLDSPETQVDSRKDVPRLDKQN